MVNVFKIKKGDTIKFRNGEVHTVVEAKTYEDYGYEYGEDWEKKQFIVIWIDRNIGGRVGLGNRVDFTYGNFGGSYYSTGQSAWDIVEIKEKENNMIFSKKVTALGHQPRKGSTSLGDWRPSPSQQSAAVEPTQPAQDEMTLRDQFAMSAMNGILIGDENWHSTSPKELSELSYVLADEMMKARKGNG